MRRNHGSWSLVDSVDDLGVVDAAQVNRRDRKVGVSELALDDQRELLPRRLGEFNRAGRIDEHIFDSVRATGLVGTQRMV